ncbi:shikimate kinase [Methyloferula stellata]|uniref:shikimate kinase n=1 Tax=Methyloferula stellata TaxID=876270 RepID=UPI00036A0962|nr:AAA family ATPase [Methyloferula stellata]
MGDEIILIGPSGAGKSTQGKLLARTLCLPQCSMDDLRWDYYREIGFDEEKQREITEKEGLGAVLRYWKPFEAHAVERLLAEHHDCVIDFGAGHSVFEADDLFARVQKALMPYPNVVLLLPSPDLDESVRVLLKRRPDLPPGVNEHFVRYHCNHDLAKIVIYTAGQKPKETRDCILKAVADKAGAA